MAQVHCKVRPSYLAAFARRYATAGSTLPGGLAALSPLHSLRMLSRNAFVEETVKDFLHELYLNGTGTENLGLFPAYIRARWVSPMILSSSPAVLLPVGQYSE